jgi:hypothetical protein
MKSFQVPALSTHGLAMSLLGLCLLSGIDSPPAKAYFVFGTMQNLGPVVNSSAADGGTSFSADGLELYFSSNRPGGFAGGIMGEDLWVSTRASIDDPWGPPVNLGPAVNGTTDECSPSISPDGLTLYFSDEWGGPTRPGGLGGSDIWMARRAGARALWDTATNVGTPIDTPANEVTPMISADGLTLIFASDRAGGQGNYDLWMSTRTTLQEEWPAPVNLGGVVNSASGDLEPSLSPDKRALVFASQRAGGYGSWDLWMTTRKTQSDAWGMPVNLGPGINSNEHEGQPVISADGRMLYFYASGHPGNLGWYDLWEAPIIPIVDFSGDGIVDTGDLVRLIESWGQADPQRDIGPFAWGDGKVDEADLEVLMSYRGQPVDDPTLMAHWALDETEGVVASDRAGGHDGTATGTPLWQPEGGQVQGALELDGTTFLKAPFVLSPAEGPFSVLAWIKGGASGQTILSQANRANWLMAEATTGALMTELRGPGRSDKPLASAAIITDGNWHRIAFTWDGAHRRLYVDGVLVAEGAQDGLAGSTADLLLGTGETLGAGTFWTGLIDDVRIYSRVVEP